MTEREDRFSEKRLVGPTIMNPSEIAGVTAMASGVLTMAYGFWLFFRLQRLAGGDKVLGAATSEFFISQRRHIAGLAGLFLLTVILMMTAAAIQRLG